MCLVSWDSHLEIPDILSIWSSRWCKSSVSYQKCIQFYCLNDTFSKILRFLLQKWNRDCICYFLFITNDDFEAFCPVCEKTGVFTVEFINTVLAFKYGFTESCLFWISSIYCFVSFIWLLVHFPLNLIFKTVLKCLWLGLLTALKSYYRSLLFLLL